MSSKINVAKNPLEKSQKAMDIIDLTVDSEDDEVPLQAQPQGPAAASSVAQNQPARLENSPSPIKPKTDESPEPEPHALVSCTLVSRILATLDGPNESDEADQPAAKHGKTAGLAQRRPSKRSTSPLSDSRTKKSLKMSPPDKTDSPDEKRPLASPPIRLKLTLKRHVSPEVQLPNKSTTKQKLQPAHASSSPTPQSVEQSSTRATPTTEKKLQPGASSSPNPQSVKQSSPRATPATSPGPTTSSPVPQVVIPTPSAKIRLLLKPRASKGKKKLGMSEKVYPIEKLTETKYYSLSDSTPIKTPASAQSEIELLRNYLDERLKGIKGPQVVFNIDDQKLALLSSTFGFVNDYVLLDGVTRVEPGFNSGCNCTGACDPSSCDCLFEEEEDLNTKIRTYRPSASDKDLYVLDPKFLERRSKIVECCGLCSCKGKCWNTVVQQGRQVQFEVFNAGQRGCGIRSPDPIVTGQFIDRYLGEVITGVEADAREAANQMGQSYLFALDWKTEKNDSDGEAEVDSEKGAFYVIDGQKFGSPTRFINHSCNPNCKIIPVSTTEHGDENLYSLAFFALCDIPAGTELTFDYNPFWDGSKAIDPHAVKCLCGEKKCRGQLWPNARKQGPGVRGTQKGKARVW
ncbi:hypothetical protein N7454_004424 [Penicillium verhagenii]|nr:hypothetical protein N7454_004424 [Penicillium verhagenii]